MAIIHNLYKQDVILLPETHEYVNGEGKKYMSFTRFYNFLVPKFNAEFMARKVAIANGSTKEAVLDQWKSATDEGSRIDAALELYAQTGQILKENEGLKGLIEAVLGKYKDYNKTFEQLVVFSHEYRVAGSLDKLGLLSNRKDSKFHLSDFKCFEGGMSYEPKGQSWLNPPFDYLPNTKYTKINIQTSYYTYLFEMLTGRKCERIFVDMIQPVRNDQGKVVKYKNHIIPMPYMKHQIETMLDLFKDRILAELEPLPVPELEDF